MSHYLQISEKIKAWTQHVPFDDNARKQVSNLANLSIIYPYIAVMPDVHVGIGTTVGSVIPTIKAIIPAAVGVDIGCGMMALQTNIIADELPDNLYQLRSAIEKAIPVGFDKWNEHAIPADVKTIWQSKLAVEYQKILDRNPLLGLKKKVTKRQINAINQLGTLGGGNHFVEICLDEKSQVWLLLHSGSRGIGNIIGKYFIELAKQDMGNLLGTLPDYNLAYLSEGTPHFTEYLMAVNWAQKYAKYNREIMMQHLLKILTNFLNRLVISELYTVNCHHNYVQQETHFGNQLYITRKGAVSARKDELGIIPGSMGAKSFIVRGLGNADSFHSCSHGAGRIMSRNEAKRKIDLAEHHQATVGVECRKDENVLDESPRAYKNIDDVINSQTDLVEIVFVLKQILCVKG